MNNDSYDFDSIAQVNNPKVEHPSLQTGYSLTVTDLNGDELLSLDNLDV